MSFLSVVAFTLLLLACYGWGYALVRWAAIRDKDYFAFLSVVGIACLIFLGGILNLVRLAYPAALGILLLLGWIFFIISYSTNAKTWLATWRARGLINPVRFKPMSGYALPIGILVIAVGFDALTLLPAAAFNIYDDFYTYMPRPFRMLQTGTLAGNPYEVLGIDSLGAHAFLQGFVLLGFPIEYVLGLDAVFGFALTGLLLIAIGKKLNLHWCYPTFALIGLIVINPQSVNISALYLASAIILGILFASFHLLDQMEKSDSDAIPVIAAGILGLLLASLIGLKGTFIGYALAYCAFLFTGLFLISKDRRKILKICGLVMLVVFMALFPWLLLYSNKYASAVHAVLHPATVATGNGFPVLKGNIAELFSARNSLYGGSHLTYGIVVLILAVAGFYSLFHVCRNGASSSSQRRYFLVAAASCAASIISYFSLGLISPPGVTIRYSCPVLIATLPFAWLAVAMAVPRSPHPAGSPNPPGIKMALILPMPLLIVALFGTNFVSRIEQAYYQRMTISFPVWENYIEYNRHAISPDARRIIRGIQDKTQPAQKILVWISTPMHLDFSRNEIYSIMNGSLVNPWMDMPLNGNVNDMVQYLKGQGIRYIMWEYQDYGSLESMYRSWLPSPFDSYRKQGERGLYLRKMLTSIMTGGNLLYDANGVALFDLQQIQ